MYIYYTGGKEFVLEWLKEIEMEQYIDSFESTGYTSSSLLSLLGAFSHIVS